MAKHSSHHGGRDRIPRDEGNGAEPQLRSSPDGGGGEAHSKQREQHRSKQVLKMHAMLQGEEQASGPEQLEQRGAYKLETN